MLRGGKDGVRIQLLGAFRVWVGPQLIPETAWRRRKAANLLKLLALSSEHRLHREEALERLWPELPPDAGENNLHRTLHIVRHVLDPGHPPAAHSPFVCLRRDLLLLCPDGELHVDADAFVEAAEAALGTQDPACHEAALGLYVGDLLPEDQYEDWAAVRREELRRLFHDLLRRLSRLHECQGAHPQVIDVLHRLVRSEPADEEASRQLMRLYALEGRQGEALRQFDRLTNALRHDVDAEPDASTRRLYEEIRTGRFPLETVTPTESVETPAVTVARQKGPGPADENSAGSRTLTNLPGHLSSFVGRGGDRTAVKHLLSSTRILTLTGTGGVGKSRLAFRVAADALNELPDGVWLVQLASVSDPSVLAQAVAGVLGIRERSERPVIEVVIDCLQPKTMLLVLDNCEHLLDACAGLVESLLGRCPRLRILATSRRPLGISGEVAWRVPSLDVPDLDDPSALDAGRQFDAVSLFLERACLVRPDFTLNRDNAPAVVDVCRRLDGIPLAIELAAARMRVLTVEQLTERLGDCLTALGGGSTSTLPRHRTLRATMDWSYELLGMPEQVLARRLAVFSGGWTLEAVEEVCSEEPIDERDVLELLSQLADHSLVVVARQGTAMRYHLLEPLRQYLAARLREAGEEERVRRRHAAWCLALAECAESRLTGPHRAAALDQLELEHDNVRSALWWLAEQEPAELGLKLAGVFWRFWLLHGHWSEGRRWLERMLERGDSDRAGLARAKALSGAGVLAYSQGDQVRAAERHEQALLLYREEGDVGGVATALNDLGRVAHFRADFKRASHLYEESLALRQELEDRPAVALSLLNLASAERDKGNYHRAAALAEQSLQLYRHMGDSWGVALALNDLGRVARVQGERRRAERLYEESLSLYRRLGDTGAVAGGLDGLGCIAQEEGDLVRAEKLHEEALHLYRKLGNEWGIGAILHKLAQYAYRRADYRLAHELSDESLDLRRRLGDTWGVAHTLFIMGKIARDNGEAERALSLFKESLTLYRTVGDRVNLAACLEALAGVMSESEDAVTATRLLGAASAFRATSGAPIPPVDRDAHQRVVAEIRAVLGEVQFIPAWRQGGQTPLERAVEEALAWEPNDLAPSGPPRARPDNDVWASLSPRQREVAALISQGRTNSRIATELGMSEQTAAVHVRNILKKLGLTSRKELAARVTGMRAVSPGVDQVGHP